MHKGRPHKTRKNKGRKSYRGGMGATEYVAGMYGDLNQQMAGADAHMRLTPVVSIQSGGKSRRGRKGRKTLRLRLPQETSSRLAGGSGLSQELKPADYGGQVGAMSDGQKGGYITELLERAVVPFGLMALQRYAGKGKRSRKNRK